MKMLRVLAVGAVAVALLVLVLAGSVFGQSGYTVLGKSVMVGTNGVVNLPAGFWTNNLAPSEVVVSQDAQGRLVLGLDNAVLRSGTVEAWTFAGGSYAQAGVVATSPVLTGGVARCEATVQGAFAGAWEMSTGTGDVWTAFEPTTNAAAVRLLLTNDRPLFLIVEEGALDTTVSGVAVFSWVRPHVVGGVDDLSGKSLRVDDPVDGRDAVNLQTLNAAMDAAAQSLGSSLVALTNDVTFKEKVFIGSVWSLDSGTNLDLVVSSGGLPVLWFSQGAGSMLLHIASLSVAGGQVTAMVSTNGVSSRPMLQYSAPPSAATGWKWIWTPLAAVDESWPSVETNAYRIAATLPDPTARSGFFRAVQESAETTMTLAGHFVPAVTNAFDLGTAEKPWRSLYLDGNTLHIGGFPISVDASSGSLTFGGGVVASTNQPTNSLLTPDALSAMFSNSIASTVDLFAQTPSVPAYQYVTIPTNGLDPNTNVLVAIPEPTYWTTNATGEYVQTNVYVPLPPIASLPTNFPPLVPLSNVVFNLTETNGWGDDE